MALYILKHKVKIVLFWFIFTQQEKYKQEKGECVMVSTNVLVKILSHFFISSQQISLKGARKKGFAVDINVSHAL